MQGVAHGEVFEAALASVGRCHRSQHGRTPSSTRDPLVALLAPAGGVLALFGDELRSLPAGRLVVSGGVGQMTWGIISGEAAMQVQLEIPEDLASQLAADPS